ERLLGGAAEVPDGGNVADELIGGIVDELGLSLEQLQLVGLLDKGEQAAADRVRGGVVAGGGNDHVMPQHVHIRQGFPPDLCVRDHRCQIAGGTGSAVVSQGGEVVDEVEEH